MMDEHNHTPLNSEYSSASLQAIWDEINYNFDEVLLELEHFNPDWILSIENYTVSIVPVTGLLKPDDGLHIPLPVYDYCPDQRKNTFKLLGKVSPGLPPPFFN